MAEIALLTGFAGYGGRGRNPAGEAVKALDGRSIGGLAVAGRILPVSYEKLQSELWGLMDELRPRVVISVGLWPGEPMIRLERIAINLADFEIPDNAGAFVTDLPITGNGAAAMMATLPLRGVEAALLHAGIPARISSTAGTFLCNATLYSTLSHAENQSPRPLAGFVHVPYLPEQVADIVREVRNHRALELGQRADVASMDLATIVRAVAIAIESSAKSFT
ncbi:MAG: pyroglutamyl-peptidase [Rhodospirillaceae bacterium]|jgi:pyroglutamyl-peptidase|nr:pyroglutamyl-peptidase [Rhodospirillaceae bacterium]